MGSILASQMDILELIREVELRVNRGLSSMKRDLLGRPLCSLFGVGAVPCVFQEEFEMSSLGSSKVPACLSHEDFPLALRVLLSAWQDEDRDWETVRHSPMEGPLGSVLSNEPSLSCNLLERPSPVLFAASSSSLSSCSSGSLSACKWFVLNFPGTGTETASTTTFTSELVADSSGTFKR